MRTGVGVLLGVLLLTAGYAVESRAEDPADLKMITIIGTTRAQGISPVEIRENAIRNALIGAVDRVALELVGGETLASDFSRWNENLVMRPQQFVQGYRVLAESKTGDRYRVMVQVGVSVPLIRKQLSGVGAPVLSMQQPSLLLMIAIQTPETSDPIFWWGDETSGLDPLEEAMSAGLTERGFFVVSHGSAADPVFTPVRRIAEPDPGSLREVGRSLNADYVVIGKAVGQKVRSEPDGFLGKGMVKFRVIRTDTGEEIGSSFQTANAAHIEESESWKMLFGALGAQAGNEVVQLIQKDAARPSRVTPMIEVTVRGAGNFKQYAAFRKTLNSVSGVKTMVVKEMKPDEAILAVEFAGNTRQLVNAVMEKIAAGFSVEVGEVTDTGIVFVIQPG